ncbi:hypothetical protein [Isoptericola sp. NPDC057559]|uniref:hypothetical protein n=1 Tax=Isoptericola sp. NPDC057559 TaxID=3346168 RepID=UPI0036C5EBCC
MTKLRAKVRYAAHGVWISPELVGWRGVVTRDGGTIEISLPADVAEFTARDYEVEAGLEPVPSLFPVYAARDPHGADGAVGVGLFAVTADFEGAVPSVKPANPFEGEYGILAEAAAERGQRLCDEVAGQFLRWLRAKSRQGWLGPVGAEPAQYGRAGLLYADSGEVIYGFGPTMTATFRSANLRVGGDALQEVLAGVRDQADVPVSQALLADAWHVSDGASRPDVAQAVLLSAIACEVRITEFIQAHSLEGVAVTAMVLKRTSTLSVLLHDVLAATVGRSLKLSEGQLYKDVAVLTRLRNQVVHEGALTSPVPVAFSPARTAQAVFDWLEVICDELQPHDPH